MMAVFKPIPTAEKSAVAFKLRSELDAFSVKVRLESVAGGPPEKTAVAPNVRLWRWIESDTTPSTKPIPGCTKMLSAKLAGNDSGLRVLFISKLSAPISPVEVI
jgi:hypothetical protein